MTSGSAGELAGGRLPLCERYASVHIGLLTVRERSKGEERIRSIPWALGVTSSGEQDILGAWPQLATDLETVEQVAKDLVLRGVRRIGLLLNDAGNGLTSAVLRAYPAAATAYPFCQLQSACLSVAPSWAKARLSETLSALWHAPTHEAAVAATARLEQDGLSMIAERCLCSLDQSWSLWALSRRTRWSALHAQEVVGRLQDGVAAAVRRHGCFDSPEAAATFAETWLAQAERRLRSRTSRTSPPHRHATVAVPSRNLN